MSYDTHDLFDVITNERSECLLFFFYSKISFEKCKYSETLSCKIPPLCNAVNAGKRNK